MNLELQKVLAENNCESSFKYGEEMQKALAYANVASRKDTEFKTMLNSIVVSGGAAVFNNYDGVDSAPCLVLDNYGTPGAVGAILENWKNNDSTVSFTEAKMAHKTAYTVTLTGYLDTDEGTMCEDSNSGDFEVESYHVPVSFEFRVVENFMPQGKPGNFKKITVHNEDGTYQYTDSELIDRMYSVLTTTNDGLEKYAAAQAMGSYFSVENEPEVNEAIFEEMRYNVNVLLKSDMREMFGDYSEEGGKALTLLDASI